MNEEERQWRNRFSELAERAYARGRYEFTDFLSLAEVQYLYSAEKELAYAGVALWGGYEGAERQIAGFGNCAYEAAFPVCCLKITPTNAKFAEELTHRDYLGALVNLGLERSTLGDILPVRGAAYVYCLSRLRRLSRKISNGYAIPTSPASPRRNRYPPKRKRRRRRCFSPLRGRTARWPRSIAFRAATRRHISKRSAYLSTADFARGRPKSWSKATE